MSDIRNSMIAAVYNFKSWRCNPRVYVTFALEFILCFLLTNRAVGYAQAFDTTLQIFEPFIWTFGDSKSILLSSMLLFLLFCDVPNLNCGVPFYLMRMNRRSWLFGQIIYLILTVLLYMVFTLVSTCVLCVKYAFPGNIWSDTSIALYHSSLSDDLILPSSMKAMEQMYPYQSMIVIFALMLIYMLVLTMIVFVFSVWKSQKAGVVSGFVFSLYGFLVSPETIVLITGKSNELYINTVSAWASPLQQATYHMHNFGFEFLPRLWQTYLIFGVLIIVFICISKIGVKKYNFVFTGV